MSYAMPKDGRPIELKVFYICRNVKRFEVANAGQIIHPLMMSDLELETVSKAGCFACFVIFLYCAYSNKFEP